MEVQSRLLHTMNNKSNDIDSKHDEFNYGADNLCKQLELAKLIQSLSFTAGSMTELEKYLDEGDYKNDYDL